MSIVYVAAAVLLFLTLGSPYWTTPLRARYRLRISVEPTFEHVQGSSWRVTDAVEGIDAQVTLSLRPDGGLIVGLSIADLRGRHLGEWAQVRAGGEPDDPADFLRSIWQREVLVLVDRGQLRVRADGTYRPTWRGALRMSARVLWPFSLVFRDAGGSG